MGTVWRFDLTKDAVRFEREQMKLIEEALEQLFARNLPDDGPWSQVTTLGMRLIQVAGRHAGDLAKYIGGVHMKRMQGATCLGEDFQPGPDCKQGNEPISKREQEEALEGILYFITHVDGWIPPWFPRQAVANVDYYDSQVGRVFTLLNNIKDELVGSLFTIDRLHLLVLSIEFGAFEPDEFETWYFHTISKDILGMEKKAAVEDAVDLDMLRVHLQKRHLQQQQVRYVKALQELELPTPSALVRAYAYSESLRIVAALTDVRKKNRKGADHRRNW